MLSLRESAEILISVVVLALCLTIATGNLGDLAKLPVYISFFGISVGLGFVLHELGHKFSALYFGAYAEFRMWWVGLVFALITSFFGVVFLAPGAVFIFAPELALWEYAVISATGPLVNLALAFFFSLLSAVFPIYLGRWELWWFSAYVNVWLGLFNMLPIPPLDGSKIFAWNVLVWFALSAIFFLAFLVIGAGFRWL